MEERKDKNAVSQADNDEYNYNKHVKEKLVKWRDDFEDSINAKLNYSAIAKRMQTDFGIQTSAQKVSAMFDTRSAREVKLQELVALAQIFHFSIWDICAFPNTPASNANIWPLVKPNKKHHVPYSQLNDQFFSGTYYCYYFRPKHFAERLMPVSENDLTEAEMTISIENGRSTVTLKEKYATESFYGEPMPPFTLTGNIYHFPDTDTAYAFITNENGRRVMSLMFTYLKLIADIRYYMTAAMMTVSRNQVHNPVFQKMAIFRVKQDLSNEEVSNTVRGILSLNTSPIVIDEETLERITSEDETLAKMVSPEKALKKCYVFSETAIRSNSYFIYDEDQKTQKMLELRKNSMLPAHEIVAEPESFADFIRHYQKKQMSEQGNRSDKF